MPHIPENVISDLRLRFVFINRNKGNPMALCSNMEEARLYYLEHYWPQDSTELEQPDLKDFIRIFLSETPSLKHQIPDLNKVYDNYINHKKTTSTHGGVILNKEKNQVLLFQDPLTKAWDFPKGKFGDYTHPTSPISRIIQQETGLIISRQKMTGRLISGKVPPDEMLTFLEVVFLCDKEIDSKMLKRTAKWFTVKEIEAWKDNEAEQTSYKRVVSFLPGVYTVLRI